MSSWWRGAWTSWWLSMSPTSLSGSPSSPPSTCGLWMTSLINISQSISKKACQGFCEHVHKQVEAGWRLCWGEIFSSLSSKFFLINIFPLNISNAALSRMILTTLRTSSRRTGRRCDSSRPLPETRLAGGLSSGPLSHLEETFPIAGIRGSSKPQHHMWPDPSSTLELIACASWCGIFLCSELNETKSTRYRPCELQISDFENAAVCCFVVLLTRAILRCLTFMTPPLCWKHFHISILGGAPPSFKSSGLAWPELFSHSIFAADSLAQTCFVSASVGICWCRSAKLMRIWSGHRCLTLLSVACEVLKDTSVLNNSSFWDKYVMMATVIRKTVKGERRSDNWEVLVEEGHLYSLQVTLWHCHPPRPEPSSRSLSSLSWSWWTVTQRNRSWQRWALTRYSTAFRDPIIRLWWSWWLWFWWSRWW